MAKLAPRRRLRWVQAAAFAAAVASTAVHAAAGGAAVSAPPPCIACRVDAGAVRRAYPAAEWERLERGQIVTHSRMTETGTARTTVEAAALVPATPAQVWAVLADFPARPAFMPNLKQVRVVRASGDHVWLAEQAKVFWRTIRYQVIGTLEPEQGLMTWTLDTAAPHDIAATQGAWQLTPLDDGVDTLVSYRAAIDAGRAVPHFVEQLLLTRSLPKILRGLRAEVARRAAAATPTAGR